MASRQQSPAAANSGLPPVDGSGSGSKWRGVVAAAWLWAFLIFFYSLAPSNNPDLPRYKLWPAVPYALVDVVDPPAEALRPPSGWSYFPQRLDLILTTAVIVAGAWGAGHLCLRLIRPSFASPSAERTVFALGLGLAVLSLLTLLLGLAGLLVRAFFAIVIAALVVVECGLRFREFRTVRADDRKPRASPLPIHSAKTSGPAAFGRSTWLFAAALVPFLLAMFLGSMLPPISFDVREYHLQGPKEFYQAGRIGFLPHNVYTSFPFLTEMLSLLAMVLRGDWYRGALAGKAVLMCFGPLTGLALYAAGRRWFSPVAGWLAALVYLTMPWTFRISVIAYAEGGLTFYLFASLLACLAAAERLRTATTGAGREFLLCGLLSGSAMACKYTAAVSVVVPMFGAACLSPYVMRLPAEHRRRAAVRTGALFLLGAAVTVGPWLVKNLVETGNPVYPLMYSLFGGRDWDAELNAKWRAAHSPPGYSDLPQRVLEVTAKNEWLTPLLFGLAPLSLLLVRRRPITGCLWLYVLWLFFTWWGLTHRVDRFWAPLTPVVAVLAGIGLAVALSGPASGRGIRSARRIGHVMAGLGIFAAVLYNLFFVVVVAAGENGFLVDLDYARSWTQRKLTPGIASLNDHLPPGSRVLMVGEAQVFDARFPLVYNTVFDRSILQEWCADARPGIPAEELPLRDAADIRERFRSRGITHVFVNWREVLRYRTTYGYTEFVAPARLKELQRRGVLGEEAVLTVAEVDGLEAAVQREIGEWAPSLVIEVNGRRVLNASVLYEVRP